jgi:ribonucleoside-diphosphate reductase alpha chain
MAHWLALGKKPKIFKTVKARRLWDVICQAAWKSAEPGLVFMERYNKWHSNYYFNYINCVNPCGEEGLPAWGVCNLSSINLAALVNNTSEMDYIKLAEIAAISVRFQDNIIDQDVYVFDGIRKTQLEGERRIGLGTMGLGDALIKMKLRYGSPESLAVIEKIYQIIRDTAFRASVETAKDKGAFPKFDAEKYTQGYFIKQLPQDIQRDIKLYGIRNSVLLMQAPTGSTSLLSDSSSGIEPVYEFEFLRRDRLGQHILRHPLYEAWFQEFKVREGREPKHEERPGYFVSANDLSPEDHIKVQAAIQKYVDASISKTVNAPNGHTVADVQKLYMMAYDLGCKGVTYMREGSRLGVLERIPQKPAEQPVAATNGHAKLPEAYMPEIKPRPMMVTGVTYKMETPVGKAYVTINTNGGGKPLEVFVNVGKAGSDVAAMAEGLGRLISLTLRVASPIDPDERARQIAEQLSGIGGSKHIGFGERRVKSLPDAIAKVIRE